MSHRGGGFHGGGGGFRGGHSGGFGGGQHRPSGGYRPHYGHGPGYYRRGYYGGYWGPGWGGGGFRGGFCQCICCIIIIVFFVAIMLFAVIGSIGTQSSKIRLDPQETRLFALSSDTNTVDITQNYGTIQTYFFTSTPSLNVAYTDTYDDSKTIVNNEWVSEYWYLNQGASATVTWNITNTNYKVDFYVLKESEYNDFASGNSFYEEYWIKAASGVYTFTALEPDTYYFVWDNLDYSTTTVNIHLDLNLLAYDVSGATAIYTGSISDTVAGKGYTAMVLRNPSMTVKCEVDYTIKANNAVMVWLPYVIFGVIGVVVILIIVNTNNKRKKMAQPNATSNIQNQSTTTAVPPPNVQINKPAERNFTINVCSYCGSKLSDEEKALLARTGKVYCQHCGSEIK